MSPIAFIGIGNLGFPIAKNLLKAGYAVTVYNRTRDKALPLEELGAVIAASPEAAITKGGIVITLLSDDHALSAVATDGFAEALGADGLHLSMSTISPETARTIAAHHAAFGVTYLAAPIFGRPEAAAAKQANVCLAGKGGEKERAIAVLKDGVAKQVFDFGEDVGHANVVKLIGNFMIASSLEMMGEAFAFGEKNGIAAQLVYDMLMQTLFAAPLFQNYGRMIVQQQYEPAAFSVPLGLKDVDLVLRTGKEVLAPMPMASLLHDRFVSAMAKGRGHMDWSVLAKGAYDDAGL